MYQGGKYIIGRKEQLEERPLTTHFALDILLITIP